jgi:FMN-dependent NADH-azoreductase
MTNILHISCSPIGANTESNKLAQRILGSLLRRAPGSTITERNLGDGTIPHVDAGYAAALGAPVASTAEKLLQGSFALSEELVDELEKADFVVIGTPMHNFTVPSTLKAWLDHVVRVRRTFTVGKEGKTAVLRDRPVFVAVASGARYMGLRARQPDFLTPLLREVLDVIGLQDVTFFSVEGTGQDPEHVADARARAARAVEEHFSSLAPAIQGATAKQLHLGELPGDGLRQTFPASDPVAPLIEEHAYRAG